MDRSRAAAGAFDGVAGDTAQRLAVGGGAGRARRGPDRRRLPVCAGRSAGARAGPPGASTAQAVSRQPAVDHGGGAASEGLESGADRAHTGSYGRTRAALLRDHLHRVLQHAAGTAALQPAGPAAPPAPCPRLAGPAQARPAVDSGDDADRSAAPGSGAAPGPGPLGGRPDPRQGQPLPGGHAGGAHHPVCRPGQAEQQQCRHRPGGLHPHPEPLRQPAAPLHNLRP